MWFDVAGVWLCCCKVFNDQVGIDYDLSVLWASMSFNAAVDVESPSNVLETYFDAWSSFIAVSGVVRTCNRTIMLMTGGIEHTQRKNAYSQQTPGLYGVSRGFQTSERWPLLHTELAFVKGTMFAIGVSVAIGKCSLCACVVAAGLCVNTPCLLSDHCSGSCYRSVHYEPMGVVTVNGDNILCACHHPGLFRGTVIPACMCVGCVDWRGYVMKRWLARFWS